MFKHIIAVFAIILFINFGFISEQGQAQKIVSTSSTYTYAEMVADIKALQKKYPHLITYKSIGKSEYGRDIYAVSLGSGNSTVFINGSHHAREWITTVLNMDMIEQYASAAASGTNISNYNARKILDETTMWFVPMVNPDGVILQQFGLSAFPDSVHGSLIVMNEGSTNFKRWKANAKGVDLNRQYDAGWPTIANNPGYPKWSHYKGTAPHSAAETKAIVQFIKEIDPEMTSAYHSSGEILYWKYKQPTDRLNRDYVYAKKISEYTGYRLFMPGSNPSGGGLTDWFIEKYKRPGFTPEVGNYAGDTHVSLGEYPEIWNQNRYVGLYIAQEGYKLYLARGGKPKAPPIIEVTVFINGEKQIFDQPAQLIEGRTLVPVRGVFEKLGAVVKWDGSTSTVTVVKNDRHITMKVGSKTAQVNGENIELDIPMKIINGRTMVPLRIIAEGIGAEIKWNGTKNEAAILLDETPPEAPKVNKLSDLDESVSGKAEINSTVTVRLNNEVIGTAVAKNGTFKITIPIFEAGTTLTVSTADESGNESNQIEVTVLETAGYPDTAGHWAIEPIRQLKEEGIIAGYPNGNFGVEDPIRRADAAVILMRSFQLEAGEQTNMTFPDVPEDQYYTPAVSALTKAGWLSGYKDGTFRPDGSLTRAEMASLLVTAFEVELKEPVSFSDVSGKFWAAEAIRILASNEVISGYLDGTFRPNQPITRAEFTALLYRCLTQFPKITDIPNEESQEPTESNEETTNEPPADSVQKLNEEVINEPQTPADSTKQSNEEINKTTIEEIEEMPKESQKETAE
ncbi:S-layer homology domain-containing protein [Bacillus taeanensis]|uniref:S-layer homology domain-containing protein n=1 Tax=Bacillus taeanensis TaxID=273032 RepID=UPI0011596B92|nr:S-layer homology domain-containing protein [Bacillus taeanensis]